MDPGVAAATGSGDRGCAMRTTAAVLLLLAAGGGTAHAYDDATLLKGRTAAAALDETLGSRLARSLKESGPAGAMAVCAYQAQALAAEVGKKEGVTIRRTSLRLRNPANAPDAYERELLARFASEAAAGELPGETLDRRVENERTVYRYAKPLVVGRLCIACHGPAAELPEDVRRVL